MMRWKPHVDVNGRAYPLNHLHPFRYHLPLDQACVGGQYAIQPAVVEIRVAFAMHCFTRACIAGDPVTQLYTDDRETRTFCHERYAHSSRLPAIARTLADRRCGFAKNKNYVTVDIQSAAGRTNRYGIFFNVMRLKDEVRVAALLTIQSAYELSGDQRLPGSGSIRFTRLVELTLQGTKPRPPR